MCVCRNVRTGGTKHTSNSSLLLLLLLLRIVHFILGGRKSLFGETTASQNDLNTVIKVGNKERFI